MTYHDALDYIYSFTNFEVTPTSNYSSKTFDLTRMERLLAALGDPHKKFQSVHVAGTKGKGSTAAIMESILRAANHLTGLYTSPHLHTFRERISVGGEMISQNQVVAGVEKLKPLVEQIPGVTTFEVMTALAFDFFATRRVEFAVLEVGLGGRLDATNVVQPRVSVITSISYDHMAILGNTLAQIAHEKAGIIKPSVPIVASPQPDEASRVIAQVAHDKNAPLTTITSDLKFQTLAPNKSAGVADCRFQLTPQTHNLDSQSFTLTRQPNFSPLAFDVKLLGRHQLANAATALATISVLRAQGVAMPDDAIRTGLANVEWHARFEILSREPYVIVDGAHNADSAHQLTITLRDLFPNARLHFVFGASGDKDIAGMFSEILPNVESLILTRSHNPRAADPSHLADLATRHGVQVSVFPDLATALEEAKQRAGKNDVVCVTGSLFVAAEAREILLAQRGVLVETDS